MCVPAASGEQTRAKISAFIDPARGDEPEDAARRRVIVLLSGIYALMVAVQANWTGPDLAADVLRPLVPTAAYKEAALDALLLDGETLFALTRYLNFVQHARFVLHDAFDLLTSIKVRRASRVYITMVHWTVHALPSVSPHHLLMYARMWHSPRHGGVLA